MNLSVDLYKDLIVNGVRFKIYRIKDNKKKILKFGVVEQVIDRWCNTTRWFPIGDYNNPREALKDIRNQFNGE